MASLSRCCGSQSRRHLLLLVLVFSLLIALRITLQRIDVDFVTFSEYFPGVDHHRPCTRDEFYATTDAHPDLIVPLSLPCLDRLLDQDPLNAALLAAYVRKKYVGQMQNASLTARTLLYHCSEGCGGLGDRMFGAATTFYLALATGARFGVLVERPAHFESYLEPLGPDLAMLEAFLRRHGLWESYRAHPRHPTFRIADHLTANPRNPTFQIADHPSGAGGTVQVIDWQPRKTRGSREYFATADLERALFPGNVTITLAATMRREPSLLDANPFLRGLQKDYRLKGAPDRVWMEIFLRLFASRPTPYLLEHMKRAESLLRGRYIVGVQIRLGHAENHTMSWLDPIRHTTASVPCFIDQAKALCDGREKCGIYVTSDSEEALVAVGEAFVNTSVPVVHGSGVISHTDRTRLGTAEDLMAAHARTYADWYVLSSLSDTLVYSRSGYGETAAYFRQDRPAHRIISEYPCAFSLTDPPYV